MADDALAQVIPFPTRDPGPVITRSISLSCGTCATRVKWSTNCPPQQCGCRNLTVVEGRIIIGRRAGELFLEGRLDG